MLGDTYHVCGRCAPTLGDVELSDIVRVLVGAVHPDVRGYRFNALVSLFLRALHPDAREYSHG